MHPRLRLSITHLETRLIVAEVVKNLRDWVRFKALIKNLSFVIVKGKDILSIITNKLKRKQLVLFVSDLTVGSFVNVNV